MTSTATADTPTEADDSGILPPYSAENAVCPKCLFTQAYTKYRDALPSRVVEEWNSRTVRRGPLPQRLERECERCSYTWDEALVVWKPGMTVDALVHALDNSTPYPVGLDRAVLEYMAFKLLQHLHIVACPDDPMWQYSDGRPPATPAPAPENPAAEKESTR